jgi:hypothetical protein
MKQLEILAHAKNLENFIYLFEEKKDLLIEKLPLEWPKIVRLRDALKSGIKVDLVTKLDLVV